MEMKERNWGEAPLTYFIKAGERDGKSKEPEKEKGTKRLQKLNAKENPVDGWDTKRHSALSHLSFLLSAYCSLLLLQYMKTMLSPPLKRSVTLTFKERQTSFGGLFTITSVLVAAMI